MGTSARSRSVHIYVGGGIQASRRRVSLLPTFVFANVASRLEDTASTLTDRRVQGNVTIHGTMMAYHRSDPLSMAGSYADSQVVRHRLKPILARGSPSAVWRPVMSSRRAVCSAIRLPRSDARFGCESIFIGSYRVDRCDERGKRYHEVGGWVVDEARVSERGAK